MSLITFEGKFVSKLDVFLSPNEFQQLTKAIADANMHELAEILQYLDPQHTHAKLMVETVSIEASQKENTDG